MTWREISQYISPRRSRFFQTDVEYGGRRKEQALISGIPLRAVRTLAAGLMAGVTSPAREWFRLTVRDPQLAQVDSVKRWLADVAEVMTLGMARSNIYNILHMLYVDLGAYCTACMFIESDEDELARGFSLPLGEYYLAQNEKCQVDTLYRNLAMTVGQLAKKFGLEKCSLRVQELHKNGRLDVYVYVVHVVCPREDYDRSSSSPRDMPYMSCWFEVGGSGDASYTINGIPSATDAGQLGLLRESGYEECPFVAARWTTTGDDTYGTGPGWDALGDCKALQLYKRKEAQAMERLVDPPLYGPRLYGNQPVSTLPGAMNWTDTGAQGQEMRPVIVVPPSALAEIRQDIADVKSEINATFFVDLWMALLQTEGPAMTAREVAERSSEKLLQLGPVMERIEDEVLHPLIARIYGIELRAGRIPPPPPEMMAAGGADIIRAEFLSIFAQAAKALSSGGIQQLTAFVTNLGTGQPQAWDNVDIDKLISEMAEALGVDPRALRGSDQIAQIRANRQRQQQQAAQVQQAMAQSQAAKNLGQASTGPNTALGAMSGIVQNQAGGPQ